MTDQQAYRIAIEAIKKQMRRYAFSANFVARLPKVEHPPSMLREAKKYADLAEALKILESKLKQKRLPI